jgi:hypothetical protein
MTQLTDPQREDQIIAASSLEEITLPSGATVHIPKCRTFFKRWRGEPLKETFGGKALIDVDGVPMFAELAIMHRFIGSGWEARWIEVYATGDKEPKILSEWKDDKYKNQILAPITNEAVTEQLRKIAVLNGSSYAG